MTFALPGVEEHEAESDRLCEHLSLRLQATGPCGWFVKAPLYVMFSLPLCHPPASFTLPFSPLSSWPADCRTATSSPVFSASCYHSQLFTFIFFHPSAPAPSFFSFFSPATGLKSLRGAGRGLAGEWRCIWLVLENVLLCSSMARAFKAQQMFQIHAYIAADPCTLMNYSLCFHWAAEHEMG